MSDINFLSNNEDHSEVKKKDEKKQKIEWSSPKKEKFTSSLTSKDKPRKGKFLGLFSFFKKVKRAPNDDIKKTASKEKIVKSQKDILDIDKDRLKSSRHEVMSLIKDEEKKILFKSKDQKKEAQAQVTDIKKQKKKKDLSQWFKKIFQKKNRSNDLLTSFKSTANNKKTNKENVIKKEPIFPERSSKHSSQKISINVSKEKKSKFDGITEQKIWQNPKTLETNLARGEISSFFDWKKGFRIMMIYVVVSSFIIGGAYGGLVLWELQKKGQENIYSSKINGLNKQIKILEEDVKKNVVVWKKIKLAGDTLNKHIYWTNFFRFLENNILSDVYFLSFSGDTNGEYSLAGKTKDFKVILDQVNTLRSNDYVVEALVGGGTINSVSPEDGSNRIDFQLKLTVDKNIFIK